MRIPIEPPTPLAGAFFVSQRLTFAAFAYDRSEIH